MTRRLALRKETLAELSADDLREVNAAAVTTGRGVPTVHWCPVTEETPTLPVLWCVLG